MPVVAWGLMRRINRGGGFVLGLALLVAACPSTDHGEDGAAAGETAGGSDDGQGGAASQPTASQGGAAQGGAAQSGAGEGGAAQSGAGEGGLGEGGALTSCPGNLCGDGSIWAEGRKCKAEGLLCDDDPQNAQCARMQCCNGRWVLGEACSGEAGGGRGGDGQ